MKDPSTRGMELVQVIMSDNEKCLNMIRMETHCLRLLIEQLVQVYELPILRSSIRVEEQVVMTLQYLAHGHSMSCVGITFGHSKQTVSRYVSMVLKSLHRLSIAEIQPIDQNIIHPKFTTTPLRQIFKNCIGAIDGTHVEVYPKAENSYCWRGRSGHTTTNVIAICNHDLMFTYFVSGAEGSMHDSTVLDIARHTPQYLFPHPLPGTLIKHISGKYYLVDSGYSNQIGYLAPYPRTNYHPHHFGGVLLSTRKEMFNMQHSSLRSTIERTFGIWKNKWRIISNGKSLRGFNLKKQLQIIQATAGLHNFVRKNNIEVIVDDNPNDDTEVLVDDDILLSPNVLPRNEMDQFRDELSKKVYDCIRHE
ncbi:protein ANTAGONIST OF LIKE HETEROCHROMATIN PROTEIN 1-like [Impatiens glandulifera]|uniref:protein ANTAGONIST OF LIKE HETEROCHROMATIN PROTEIN 1-like n=1 Tax=Impatiens glandulifera TaxID=253017 RepID=UPI001FB07154|nr:protein ANTAGONIST OF LIKE HETEROCHROMATIN PROTEIN 1-like [Impatiens glandulifera]